MLTSNPAERAKRPRGARRELGEVWTPGDHRLSAFYRLAAYTGGRRGELLCLRWNHVDLDGAEIRITGSTAVIDGRRTEGTTKGGRSRTVSIDPGTVQVRKEHRTRRAAERLTSGPQWRGQANGYVFTTVLGEPVYPDTVEQLAEAAVIFARAVGLIDGRQANPCGLTGPLRFRVLWVVAQSCQR